MDISQLLEKIYSSDNFNMLGIIFSMRIDDNEVTNLIIKGVKWPDFKYVERSVIYKNVVVDLLKTFDLC